jgi:hypothetical protein
MSAMKTANSKSRLPQHDYRMALQSAVSWLGERYLLAEPLVRRIEAPKPFFVEVRGWHVPRRARVV